MLWKLGGFWWWFWRIIFIILVVVCVCFLYNGRVEVTLPVVAICGFAALFILEDIILK